MSESFLSDAGSLFFAAWILVVAAVSIVAFGHDLFPSKTRFDGLSAVEPTTKPRSSESNLR
jgi:hypothetical protein